MNNEFSLLRNVIEIYIYLFKIITPLPEKYIEPIRIHVMLDTPYNLCSV